jgi:hypothetical protein
MILPDNPEKLVAMPEEEALAILMEFHERPAAELILQALRADAGLGEYDGPPLL